MKKLLINILNISEISDCSSLLGNPNVDGSPAFYLSFLFSLIKYIAILLLIILTIMDFVGAVASQDNDILKKAFNKAVTRMILCVILFLIPTVIDFVLQFIDQTSVSNCINTNM